MQSLVPMKCIIDGKFRYESTQEFRLHFETNHTINTIKRYYVIVKEYFQLKRKGIEEFVHPVNSIKINRIVQCLKNI